MLMPLLQVAAAILPRLRHYYAVALCFHFDYAYVIFRRYAPRVYLPYADAVTPCAITFFRHYITPLR